MEWKKETMSEPELERRQQEYLRAAMSMMKRSHAAAPESKTEAAGPAADPDPESQASEITETALEAGTATSLEANTAYVPEETAHGSGEPEISAAEAAEAEITAAETVLTAEAPSDEPEEEQMQEKNDSTENFGVYTADELMNGKHDDEGLKKAAEILEEMTRNAEMMKKLVNEQEDGEPGTTDFPDFSYDPGEEDDGIFREDEMPENDQPQEENE